MDRKEFVGASEVGALFGLHPYVTARMLYHMKRGELPEKAENPSMLRGKILEPAIAELYMASTGAKLLRSQQITPHPTIPGLACTPDYTQELTGWPNEFKTTLFMKGDAAADHHIIQLNTQMMCMDKPAGSLIYYDMSKDSFIIHNREVDKGMTPLIAEAVAKFWERVKSDKPPEVAVGDVETLTAVFKEKHVDTTINLDDDEDFSDTVRQFQEINEQRKVLEKEEELLKAKIYSRMGDFTRATFGKTEVKRTLVDMPEHVRKAHTQVKMYIKAIKG